MRILNVSHFFESHGGGIERVAGHICRQLTITGDRAIWAASSSDEAPSPPTESLPLDCINPTERLTGLPMPIPGPRALIRLARAVRESDAVVIHDALYVTSILAMIMARTTRKRVVLIEHIAGIAFTSRLMQGAMALAKLLVMRPMLSAADELVFISDTVRRELMGDSPWRPSHLLFNGVDAAIFRPDVGADRAAVRAEHNLPVRGKLVIFVGRFVEKKGLPVIQALARQRTDLHFALAGAGMIDPASWGLPNIHVVGQKSPQALADLYRAADLLILPSPREGFPLVVQEAMACGLPVICGADTATADPKASVWLRGAHIDMLDPAGSATRCSEAIDNLDLSDFDRARMAEYAARTYSWPTMATTIARLLRGPPITVKESASADVVVR